MNILFSITNLLLIFIYLSLIGCQSTVIKVPTANMNKPLSEDKGYVVAKVLDSHSYYHPMNSMLFNNLSSNSSKEQKGLWLKKIGNYEHDTDLQNLSLFYGELPEGRYSLDSLVYSSFYQDQFVVSSTNKYVFGNKEIGVFEVKKGQVTDLGVLLYADFEVGGEMRETVTRLKEKDLFLYNNLIPNINTLGALVDTWNKGIDSDVLVSLGKIMKAKQWSYRSFYNSKRLGLFVGLNLGMIINIDTNGDWMSIDLDTNFPISKFAESPDGKIAAASSYGGVFVKNKAGHWKRIFLPKEFNKVDNIKFNGESRLEAILSSTTGTGIFSINLDSGLSNWKKEFAFSTAYGWRDSNDNPIETLNFKPFGKAKKLMRTHYVNQTNTLYVSLSFDSNFSFDLGLINRGVIKSAELSRYRSLPIGTGSRVFLRENDAWGNNISQHYNKKKEDAVRVSNKFKNCIQGQDCQDKKNGKYYDEFRFNKSPLFLSRERAISFVTTEKEKGKVLALKTTNGGQTWEKIATNPPGKNCELIETDGLNELSIICKENLNIHTSKDFGENWTTEYIGFENRSSN